MDIKSTALRPNISLWTAETKQGRISHSKTEHISVVSNRGNYASLSHYRDNENGSKLDRTQEGHNERSLHSDILVIQSHCGKGQLDLAVQVMSRIQNCLPQQVYLSLLKACIKCKSSSHVRNVYAHMISHYADINGLLGDYLIMALARCGALEEAWTVNNLLPHLSVFSWTAIISAYAEFGLGHSAVELYHSMIADDVLPDRYTYVGLFKACGSIPDLMKGNKLHTEALMQGFTSSIFVNNSLISMYGKCHAIAEAENIFGTMAERDLVSWNALLSAYVEVGLAEKAFNLYREMQEEHVQPDPHTFVISLQACCIIAENEDALLIDGGHVKAMALSIGMAFHADAHRKGFTSSVYVGTALVSMYCKCGTIKQTETMFSILSQSNIISWNSMLSAYVENGQGEKALQFFAWMQHKGISPDELTVLFAFQACSVLVEENSFHAMSALEIGQVLHSHDVCTKDFSSDAFVGTTLLIMYAKCGAIADAEDVFIELSERSIVSWLAMLSAYVEQGQGKKALQLYRQMQGEGLSLNEQAYVFALQACSILVDDEAFPETASTSTVIPLEIGMALDLDACMDGYRLDVFVGTSLVSMYCKCGSFEEAEAVFNALNERDIVTWTAMLSEYVDKGHDEKAILLFREMGEQQMTLDDVTVICALQACGRTSNLEMCQGLHFYIVAAGYDGISSVISTLIRSYGSCANMMDSQATFDAIPEPDNVSWTSCISGYSGEGKLEQTFQMFEQLKLTGMTPDEFTFSSLLSACSHTGYVLNALDCLDTMIKDYGIFPDTKHYNILIDLFGRAGDFDMVNHILRVMPMEADSSVWVNLMGACLQHNNPKLAEEAFNQAVTLQPEMPTAYIFMSNSYADADFLFQ